VGRCNTLFDINYLLYRGKSYVDKKLYVERWLLMVKDALAAASLDAHVRALDFKGGKFLALEVHQGDEALEMRYQKRWTGAGQVAVATGATITAQVRQVHEQLLRQHRRLLENGLRRFLRRSIGLLAAMQAAFRDDAELPRRYETALRELGGLAGARMAAVVRRRPGLFLKYEVLPAVALKEGSAIRFAGLSRGQLVDVTGLIKTEASKPEEGREPGQTTGFRTIQTASQLPPKEGVELLAPGAAAVGAAAMLPPGAGPGNEGGADQTAQVVSGKSSALADASCPNVACASGDCAAADWGSVDCGNVDCSGAPDCS